MSILIKGMKMPTTCGRCWFCHAVGIDKWHCRLTGKSFASYSVGWGSENNTGENGQQPYIRRDDCPLIPVPQHVSRWIPVTEKPPLKVGDDGYNGYLVYANGYYEVADYTTDKFDNAPYFYVDGEYEPDVTHYMPLPEPPKEETE